MKRLAFEVVRPAGFDTPSLTLEGGGDGWRWRFVQKPGSGLLAFLLFFSIAAAEAAEFRHAAEYDGTMWKAMSEEEKMAYLAGFLAGVALEQVLSSGAQDQEVHERIMALRAEGRLHFPYAPHVYKARLEDYYFYQDRLQKTIPDALLEINRHLKPRP